MDFHEEKDQVQSQPEPQPQIQSQVVLREVGQRSDNRLAVTSVVFGIITLVFFWFPILSLITGIIGLDNLSTGASLKTPADETDCFKRKYGD